MIRPRLVVALLFAALVTGLAAGPPAPAWARSDRLVIYAADRVFPTAVRFLRIDAHAKLTEKDAGAGYVLFEVTIDGKSYPGSLELITADSTGRPAARLVLTIEGQPSYVEAVLLDKLEAKLRAELGNPPPPPPAHDKAKDPPATTPAPAPSPAP